MRLLPRNPFLAVAVAALVFAATALLASGITAPFPHAPPWLKQAVLKGLLLIVSLGFAAAERLSLRDLGFRRATGGPWSKAIGAGILLGSLATVAVLLSGSTGLRDVLRGFPFWAVFLWIWLLSSFSEEVFCRGWFQSSLERGAVSGAAPLWPSAALFGGMHLTLFLSGTDAVAVITIVIATTLLGWVAAWARRASASLFPAIAGHVAFNVGGMLGGILYTVGFRLATGHLPPLVNG
jgi:membrane protease YdiL (CAAX protease family)